MGRRPLRVCNFRTYSLGRSMNFRYKCGQPMPKNVIELIHYMGKVGVLTRSAWNQYLGFGSAEWKREQLQNLEKRGILIRHSCKQVKNAWVLSKWCFELLRSSGLLAVTPVAPHLIEHDELIGTSLVTLKRHGICQRWITEKELKANFSKEYLIEKQQLGAKYPDAIFEMAHGGKTWIVALEYERTGKSVQRYKSIFREYEKFSSVSQILYIVEDPSIKRRVQSGLLSAGSLIVSQKVGLVDASEWKIDPLKAPIQKGKTSTSFAEIFKIS